VAKDQPGRQHLHKCVTTTEIVAGRAVWFSFSLVVLVFEVVTSRMTKD
jgi:hypothetical protein